MVFKFLLLFPSTPTSCLRLCTCSPRNAAVRSRPCSPSAHGQPPTGSPNRSSDRAQLTLSPSLFVSTTSDASSLLIPCTQRSPEQPSKPSRTRAANPSRAEPRTEPSCELSRGLSRAASRELSQVALSRTEPPSKPSRTPCSPSHLSHFLSTSCPGVGEVTFEFRNFTASVVGANSPLLGWIRLDADLPRF
uniref:Uncharacterized protein n=1 Tax=Cucumis melo subsp. melo TaxID=412675 RepID=E5GB94_CUCME|nr:hypothetical protein [Cucumis melo subsp. melo]